MVTMRLPATVPTLVRQARAAWPSIKTVQAAHWPSPHPYLVPVRSRSSRKMLSSVRSASASIRRFAPLISSSVTRAMNSPPAIGRRTGLRDLPGSHLESSLTLRDRDCHFDLIAGNFPFIVQLKLIAVKIGSYRKRQLIAADLSVGNGYLSAELVG